VVTGDQNRAKKSINTCKSGEKDSDRSIVQSKGISSYKPEEPDTRVWRNSSQTVRLLWKLVKYVIVVFADKTKCLSTVLNFHFTPYLFVVCSKCSTQAILGSY
jgi:hypothetical protein